MREQQEANSIAEAAAADNIASTTQPKDPGKRPNGVAPGRAEHKQAAGHKSSEPDAPPAGKKGGYVCQACHKHHRSAHAANNASKSSPLRQLSSSTACRFLTMSYFLLSHSPVSLLQM